VRATLARGTLAVTSMVAIAFLVPLALLARQIAHDRALADARQETTAMVAALAVTDEPAVLARAVASTTAGADGRLVVHLPGAATIGAGRAAASDVALVAGSRQPLTVDTAGGRAYLQPTALSDGRTAVIEVFVPAAELRRGVPQAWLVLAGLAAALVAASIALADRLGAQVVAAARGLSHATRRLGTHDLTVRVRPAGPPELAEVGTAFNLMADRIASLVEAERERAADLSHRLRTPLTALRLDADALPGSQAADRVRESIDALEVEVDALIMSARDQPTRPGPVDLVDVLADRLTFWTVPAEHQGRAWQVVGADRPVWVAASRTDLIAVVDSLLGNVIRHTPAGTPMRVTVAADALVVEDGGPGIADSAAAVRRGVSGADSTGLGLDIVRRVAAAAGGSVHIGRSRDLGGARVSMTFDPAAAGATPEHRFRRGRARTGA
jgi:signal transduction histidine kinase